MANQNASRAFHDEIPLLRVAQAFSDMRAVYEAELNALSVERDQALDAAQAGYNAWPHRDEAGRPLASPSATDPKFNRELIDHKVGPLASLILGYGFQVSRFSEQELHDISEEKPALTIGPRLLQRIQQLTAKTALAVRGPSVDHDRQLRELKKLEEGYTLAVESYHRLHNPLHERLWGELTFGVQVCDQTLENLSTMHKGRQEKIYIAKVSVTRDILNLPQNERLSFVELSSQREQLAKDLSIQEQKRWKRDLGQLSVSEKLIDAARVAFSQMAKATKLGLTLVPPSTHSRPSPQ